MLPKFERTKWDKSFGISVFFHFLESALLSSASEERRHREKRANERNNEMVFCFLCSLLVFRLHKHFVHVSRIHGEFRTEIVRRSASCWLSNQLYDFTHKTHSSWEISFRFFRPSSVTSATVERLNEASSEFITCRNLIYRFTLPLLHFLFVSEFSIFSLQFFFPFFVFECIEWVRNTHAQII